VRFFRPLSPHPSLPLTILCFSRLFPYMFQIMIKAFSAVHRTYFQTSVDRDRTPNLGALRDTSFFKFKAVHDHLGLPRSFFLTLHFWARLGCSFTSRFALSQIVDFHRVRLFLNLFFILPPMERQFRLLNSLESIRLPIRWSCV